MTTVVVVEDDPTFLTRFCSIVASDAELELFAAVADVASCAATLVVLAVGGAGAEDLRSAMEADNARWLAAFNTNAPAVLAAMYTTDAIVLPPGPAGTQPVNGSQAIGKFWEDLLKIGDRKDHTWEIVSVQQDGQYAYQVARLTLDMRNKNGGFTNVSGNTLRIFERQPDGTWLTKVHIFNRHQ